MEEASVSRRPPCSNKLRSIKNTGLVDLRFAGWVLEGGLGHERKVVPRCSIQLSCGETAATHRNDLETMHGLRQTHGIPRITHGLFKWSYRFRWEAFSCNNAISLNSSTHFLGWNVYLCSALIVWSNNLVSNQLDHIPSGAVTNDVPILPRYCHGFTGCITPGSDHRQCEFMGVVFKGTRSWLRS